MGVYKERGRADWQHPDLLFVLLGKILTAKTGDTGGYDAKKRLEICWGLRALLKIGLLLLLAQ